MATELKPYLWNEQTGEVFCAYCGSRGLKPNKHPNPKTRTCATCGKKHKAESINILTKINLCEGCSFKDE